MEPGGGPMATLGASLRDGVTAARLALDEVVGVRIPVPQPPAARGDQRLLGCPGAEHGPGTIRTTRTFPLASITVIVPARSGGPCGRVSLGPQASVTSALAWAPAGAMSAATAMAMVALESFMRVMTARGRRVV